MKLSRSEKVCTDILSKFYALIALIAFHANCFAENEDFVPNKSSMSKDALCRYEVLKDLGWKFRASSAHKISKVENSPCAQQPINEIVMEVPQEVAIKDLDIAFMEAINSQSSQCLFKKKLAPAVSAAAEKLSKQADEKHFGFVDTTKPDLGENQTNCKWKGDGGAYGGSCSISSVSPSEAINFLYSGKCGADCLVCNQLLALAGQYELYGPKDFDKAFKNDEIVVGRGANLSGNPFQGLNVGGIIRDPTGTILAELGPLAFVGIQGYIGNVKGEQYLDTPADRGENFTVISVTNLATQTLIKNGGLEYYNKKNDEIWNKYTKNSGKLLPEDSRILVEDPVYSGTKVYVHPLGIMTLGEHIERLLGKNPRTPYTFKIAADRQMTDIYDRYKNFQISKCLANEVVAPEPPMDPNH